MKRESSKAEQKPQHKKASYVDTEACQEEF